MSKKLFTPEEMDLLRRSPHIDKVTPRSVQFTPEFKQLYFNARKTGEDGRSILKRCAIPTDILGHNRVRALDRHIMAKGGNFLDRRTLGRKTVPKSARTDSERLAQLEMELAYTKQEVEFLKKLTTANMEAMSAWVSRHPRMSSTN